MPEYLAPGVYVEEISFRAKSIEGVSTSVAGFIGPTRFGPTDGEPELLTSFSDFTRIYGGIDNMAFAGETEPAINHMAHAVRAFFDNGGSKLYVTRVYQADPPPGEDADANTGKAELTLGSPVELTLRARFPGAAGDMEVIFAARAAANGLVETALGNILSGTRAGDVVFVKSSGGSVAEGIYDVISDASGLSLAAPDGGTTAVSSLSTTQNRVHRVALSVRVRRPGRFDEEMVWEDLAATPGQRNAMTEIFREEAVSRSLHLSIPFAIITAISSGAQLIELLLGQAVLDSLGLQLATRDELLALSPLGQRPGPEELEQSYLLVGGNDGRRPISQGYLGEDEGPEKSGLFTFEGIEEISIVAAPGSTADDPNLSADENQRRVIAINNALIAHCQLRMRYRVAVLDAQPGQILSEVRDTRGKLDSTHAAFYYPWVTVLDPLDPEGRREIAVPPSGFVAGIYARTDVLHGVVKAPANEVVFGAVGFERLLNKAQQDILNPLGINCFRFFEGRGLRLWGARTISSDPEWKYISVRRYFAYLEHSIDRGTQWAVFENNGDALWANVRRTVEDFLFNEWRNGALLGLKPEQAFFVRCDRSTMTQNDLDNGRLICLVGVAVVKPAEFVIFRIGQMTADARS
jgi:phage tail sheath protein FI